MVIHNPRSNKTLRLCSSNVLNTPNLRLDRIEGKFGQAKRKFSLDLVKTKLKETSETSIAITFLVVNLSQLLRQFLLPFLSFSFINKTIELNKRNTIIKTYSINYFMVV